MPLRAVLLDLDGTLVDTNALHVESFALALQERGHDVDRAAIARQVGKGAAEVVGALLDVDDAENEAIREAAKAHFHRLAERRTIRLFPEVEALLGAVAERGLRTAIATASNEADLDAIFESAGTDLRDRVDAVTTSSDVDRSKPAPDTVGAALDRLGVAPDEAVLVGDTPYDFEAAGRAGVAGVGVATWVDDRAALQRAGARAAYLDAADLLAHLDEALAAAERPAAAADPA
ncbi:MAG: HAD family hydrolase [Rhodothermales bacterium]|nr:HAD family hydrolase [Rhodothermales bacterium]